MADDERSRLHEIVDRLPEQELGLACQLLDLLAHGSASLRVGRHDGGAAAADAATDVDGTAPAECTPTSPETLSKLARLSDEELIQLDELLESDHAGARQFWWDRFGEALPDAELTE